MLLSPIYTGNEGLFFFNHIAPLILSQELEQKVGEHRQKGELVAIYKDAKECFKRVFQKSVSLGRD
jgi:hypothetical protein